eukprot:RCo006778
MATKMSVSSAHPASPTCVGSMIMEHLPLSSSNAALQHHRQPESSGVPGVYLSALLPRRISGAFFTAALEYSLFALGIVALYYVSRYSFLLFHAIAELFSVV